MSCNPLIFFIRVGHYFGEQLGQVVVNGLSNTLTGEWRLSRLLWWIQQVFQVDEPLPLSSQSSHLVSKRQTTISDLNQATQKYMPPFFWQRVKEAARAVRSSKTRTPPSSKGATPPSNKVERMASA